MQKEIIKIKQSNENIMKRKEKEDSTRLGVELHLSYSLPKFAEIEAYEASATPY